MTKKQQKWCKKNHNKNIANKTGFSLIELLVVLAIVLVLCTGTGVAVSLLHRSQVRNVLYELSMVCWCTQQHALAAHTDQHIICDPAAHTYTVRGVTHGLPRGVRFGVLPNIQGPPASPAHAVHNPITFANNTITCFADGVISAGTVYLCDTQQQTQCALTCGVGPYSLLRLYRHDEQWRLIP